MTRLPNYGKPKLAPFTTWADHLPDCSRLTATSVRKVEGIPEIKGMEHDYYLLRYHVTDIVRYCPATQTITLDTNKHHTRTTLRRMSDALGKLGTIHQAKRTWIVCTNAGEYPFRDGMVLDSVTGELIHQGHGALVYVQKTDYRKQSEALAREIHPELFKRLDK